MEYRIGSVNSTAALLSIAFVLVTINSVFLWTLFVHSARKERPLQKKKLSVAAGFLAVLAFLSTALGVSLVKQQNEYSKWALSDTPLSSIEPTRKRLVVEYIRRVAANSQAENKSMAEAQTAQMKPAVYSPESFANQQVMQSTLAFLTRYAQIDFDYALKQQAAREDFHRKMGVCDAEYLKNWDAERRDQDELEKSANQLEHDWLASVNTLYTYGEQHARMIEVKKGEISISNPTVREKFDGLFGQSKALHEKLESIVQEEVKQQQQAKDHIGE